MLLQLKRGRGLARIEDSVDAAIRGCEHCIIKRKGRLITETSKRTEKQIRWVFLATKCRNLKREDWYMA